MNFDVCLDPRRIRVPEKSSSPVSAILNPNFAAISRKFREILPCTLELNPKEQILTLTSEVWLSFVGKITQNILNQEQNGRFWRGKICLPRKNKDSRKTQVKVQLNINLSYFSFRFCMISNPSYFELFWNQCFSFSKPRDFLKFSFVKTREKIRF